MYKPVVHRLRLLALLLLVLLITTIVLWQGWLAPVGEGRLVILALPLLLAFRGLYMHRIYTYRWLSLLLWIYVLWSVVALMTVGGITLWLALLTLLLSISLFMVCVFYIRYYLK